jgi:hypothetical protein
MSKRTKKITIGTVIYYNFMNSTELEQVNESEMVFLPFWLYDHYGSGSIEKSLFYSTPGQYEQEYLAENSN